MRIPYWLVVPLCLLAMGGLWRWRTKDLDFLTPPSEQALEEVRKKTEASRTMLPGRDLDATTVFVPPAAPQAPPPTVTPAIPLGDTEPPSLDEYAGHRSSGAAAFIELAQSLEELGRFRRALLAWERVLDSAAATLTEREQAVEAVRRLRPTLPPWNADSEAALPLVLHLGTDVSHEAVLAPVLDDLRKTLSRASDSIVVAEIAANYGDTRRPDASLPPPVALWFSAGIENGPTTDVTAFTPKPDEVGPEAMRDRILRATFRILSSQISKSTSLEPPVLPSTEPAAPEDDLSNRVTRLHWREFVESLMPAPEE